MANIDEKVQNLIKNELQKKPTITINSKKNFKASLEFQNPMEV